MPRTSSRGLLLLLACPLAAQLPDIYRGVDRVTWVVDNIDRVALGWEKVGFIRLDMRQDAELPVTFRGKATKAKVRMASGYLGDVRVDWIQPMDGTNAFTEYQKQHRSGVFSLVHRVPALAEEEARLRGLGVEILQKDDSVTYFDTEKDGKYALGLRTGPETPPLSVPSDRRIVQFAFTAKDLKPIGEYWARLGLGNMAFNKGNLSDVEYHGQAVAIEQQFGWQRNRKVVYEWLAPITTPNTFDDHMKKYGEGVHHLAVNVPDMPKAIAERTAAGFKMASTGAWGEKGKQGSGRFAYVDTCTTLAAACSATWAASTLSASSPAPSSATTSVTTSPATSTAAGDSIWTMPPAKSPPRTTWSIAPRTAAIITSSGRTTLIRNNIFALRPQFPDPAHGTRPAQQLHARAQHHLLERGRAAARRRSGQRPVGPGQGQVRSQPLLAGRRAAHPLGQLHVRGVAEARPGRTLARCRSSVRRSGAWQFQAEAGLAGAEDRLQAHRHQHRGTAAEVT